MCTATRKWLTFTPRIPDLRVLEGQHCHHVLFSQALTEAVSENGLPDSIVEVGPHHALKGPALQTLANLNPLAANIPYIGLSTRGTSGIATMTEAIGSFWAYLGPASFNTVDYVSLFDASFSPQVVKNLPSYPFDHSQAYWFKHDG